jgi:hypothetical protein
MDRVSDGWDEGVLVWLKSRVFVFDWVSAGFDMEFPVVGSGE